MVKETHKIFFSSIKWFYISRFGDLEQAYAHQENMEYEQLIVFVAMYHTAVGKLLAWEREPRNAVGMYCGSKDRLLSDTE